MIKRSTALFLLALLTIHSCVDFVLSRAKYGVDTSFPIHSRFSSSEPNELGDRAAFYEEYMEGCRLYYGSSAAEECDTNEQKRLDRCKRQPQSMVVSVCIFPAKPPQKGKRNAHHCLILCADSCSSETPPSPVWLFPLVRIIHRQASSRYVLRWILRDSSRNIGI